MFDVFSSVILPIFVVVALAAALHRWRRTAVDPLSQTALYLLTPALIFTSTVSQQVSTGTSVAIIGAALVTTLLLLALALACSRLLGHDRAMQSAFMLVSGFPNSGNMALPVLLLAFGQEGLNLGVVVFMTQAIVSQSLGIFVAARSELVGLAPLKQVLRLPAFWAALAALLVRATGLPLPPLISQPLNLLSQAAVPVMLVVLGFQIGAGVQFEQLGSVLAALGVRLLISAPIGYAVAALMGLSGMAQGVLVIVFAMPVAVSTTILAAEFRANPRFVSSVVIASTACSVLTLTVVVAWVRQVLGAG